MSEAAEVPEWLVERLAAGDLDADTTRRVRSRLVASGGLERLEKLATSNRAILEAYPPAAVLRELERRLERVHAERKPRKQRVGRWAWPGLALAVPAAALLLLVLVPDAPQQGSDLPPAGEPSETVTDKGLSPHLIVYRKVASGAARLMQSSRVHPGDVLQVAYVGAGRRYGVIASVDALGAVTLHLPENPGQAAKLTGEGEVPVPHAFELDDSPGFERFVFATSDAPFATATLVEALRSGELLGLPAGLELSEVMLKKEPRP